MTERPLTSAIKRATKRAFEDLIRQHPAERFYYFALTTTGEAHSPVVSAWSVEALDAAVENEGHNRALRSTLKWSSVDSPYYAFGEHHFREVAELFSRRPSVHGLGLSERTEEVEFRMRAMENAIRELNDEGLFGIGSRRHSIVVNVEVMPPDRSNTERALRLNPSPALTEWLEEAAEI